MNRHPPPRPALSRRSFLALSSAAVGLWLRPAWAGPGGRDEPGPSSSRERHAPVLRVPRRTSNGAKVPIVVEMAEPMTPEHHVTTVRVRNDGDPISAKGTFHFTPANGRVYLSFQARMHEGSSAVTASAECNLHGTLSASSPIEIPLGAGGCGGGAAGIPRTPGEDVRAPVIRIPELVERGVIRLGDLIHVQVKMRHPNRTGLALRDGRFVPEAEPLHLDALDVLYDEERVSHFSMTSALSDDPLITFALLARRKGKVTVVVTNNRGERFEATHEIHLA